MSPDAAFDCIVEIPKGEPIQRGQADRAAAHGDDAGIDDKVLAVPLTDPGWDTLCSLEEVPDQLQAEIQHFFLVYKQLENKKVEVEGWLSREDAIKEIAASRERFRESGLHN